MRNLVAIAIFAVSLSLALSLAAAAEPMLDPKLAPILGDDLKAWTIGRRGGAADDFQILQVDGQPVISAGPNATILTGPAAITSDSEVTIRFRFAPNDKNDTWFWLTAGVKRPEENGENIYKLGFSVPKGPETEHLYWQVMQIDGKPEAYYGNYRVRHLPPSRTTWPEMVKSRVEREHASVRSLRDRWLTVRYVLRPNAFQIWLDGRLLREAEGKEINPFGQLKLTLFEGVQLGSVRIRALSPEETAPSNFEPLRLDEYLNAGTIAGEALDRSVLPAPGKALQIGNVPFLFPAIATRADGMKLDHIDLGPSWLTAGQLAGAFDGWEGDAGRWNGALSPTPGRIQFRVRNGRYSVLHLLAAFEGEPDTTPIVTAQFYRPAAGHPVSFTARAPLFAVKADVQLAAGAPALAVKTTGGKAGRLHLVTIPLEPEGLDRFADNEVLEFELTKQVRTYRSFPDPIYFSEHQAGLPSGVHVYAATFERPPIEVDLQPERTAHIWTAPQQPSYVVHLRNTTNASQAVELELSTVSHDGVEQSSANQSATIPPLGTLNARFPLTLKRYGHHDVRLRVKDAGREQIRTRSLAHLHPDTRERGNWVEGRGPIFGFWDWNGGHGTIHGIERLEVMAAAGAESKMSLFQTDPPEKNPYKRPDDTPFALAHQMQTHFLAYQLSMGEHSLGVAWDPTKRAEMQQALIAKLKAAPMMTSPLNKPELALFFAEPVLGPVSYMSHPEFYGEPPYEMTEVEKKSYDQYLNQFVIAAEAIKREWPHAKCLMPWGLPLFPKPFLEQSKEAIALMDGPALDIVPFERLPEMQLHQVTLSSQIWQLKQAWEKTGKPWPNFTSIEGPCVSPARPGALTMDQEAEHSVRALLVVSAYGGTRHLGWPTPSACAGSWGETHYGGGLLDRLPLYNSKPVYPMHAAFTRQLNRMNFTRAVPTGSNTVCCLEFKHYKTGELLHVFWTLRGKRPLQVSGGEPVVYDAMDNQVPLRQEAGVASFTIGTGATYVRGLPADFKVKLGEPMHSDSTQGEHALSLGELGDGSWTVSAARDYDYENSHPEFVRRFPSPMTIKPIEAPAQYGKALAVHLEKPEKERKVMPFYTTLVPKAPMVVPGRASHLGLWVKANSDWGRVVYFLRDAKGERWISVGRTGEWNVDDTHCWSAFCFDGWRYLKFEMPGNAPYDLYHEMGTTFWGDYGAGDGSDPALTPRKQPLEAIVDLPLSLEKIVVERRTHVIVAPDLHPADPSDVLLGRLNAEYETADDKTDEAVRLSKLRMK